MSAEFDCVPVTCSAEYPLLDPQPQAANLCLSRGNQTKRFQENIQKVVWGGTHELSCNPKHRAVCISSDLQCVRQAVEEAPSAESAPAEGEAGAAPAEGKPAAEEPVEENLGDKVLCPSAFFTRQLC